MGEELVFTPDVIFVQKYHQYFAPNFRESKTYETNKDYWEHYITKRDFYACTNPRSFNSIISYMTRKNACDKTNLEYEQDLIDLRAENHAPENIMNYMGERPGSTGLFSENPEISKKEVKDLRKELASLQSTIFECVMSFTPEFSQKYVDNKLAAYKLLNEVMPKYFISKGLNPSEMRWFAAYHTNTDNRHCHIVFYQKPGCETYRDLHFTQNNFDKMKEFVVFKKPLTHEYENAREPILAQLRKAQSNNHLPDYYNKLEPVREVARNKKQFARCTKEEKGYIRAYMDFVYKTNPDFKQAYDHANSLIDKAQRAIIANYKTNGIEPTEYALGFAENRKKELDYRICNQILKMSYTDLLLNDTLTNKRKKSALSDTLIKQSTIVDTRLKKYMKNNQKGYEEYKGLSLWTKQGILALRTGYSKTMNSKTIWNEIMLDRKKELERLKELGSLSNDELAKEQEKLMQELERF